MIQALPVKDWPASERLAWDAACEPTVRLRRGGRAAHMRPETQRDLARRYGYFLRYLFRTRKLDPAASAGTQVTPKAVKGFIAFARQHWGSVTLAQSVFKLRRFAEIIRPEEDFSWLRQIEQDLRADARPKLRRENVTSDELLEAGESLFREAEDGKHLDTTERARLARNGLMVALLAVRPLRHKNFGDLTLGTTFRRIDSCWWIVLEPEDTKAHRADERRVPDYLNEMIERYLSVHRPILLAGPVSRRACQDGCGAQVQPTKVPRVEDLTGPLWIASTGAPLTYSGFGAAITDTTEAVIGIRLSPHAFRRAAKATATYFGGAHRRLAQGVLQHRDERVGAKHYDSNSTARAALELTAIVRELTRRS